MVDAFLYHFWMAAMTPIKRNGGNQYLHRKIAAYRDAIRRKINAYHRFIQLGLIAQGLMQVLATTVPELAWRSLGSWLRTVRPGICPSDLVVAEALRNSLPEFLADGSCAPDLAKFIRDRIDLERAEATRLTAEHKGALPRTGQQLGTLKLRDLGIAILLSGTEPARRKHIDWELYSSMIDGQENRKRGIVVVQLPGTNPQHFSAAHGHAEKRQLQPQITDRLPTETAPGPAVRPRDSGRTLCGDRTSGDLADPSFGTLRRRHALGSLP